MNDDLEDNFSPALKRPKQPKRPIDHGGMEGALRADPRVAMWLAAPLDLATGRALLRLLSLPDLERLAIMPDVHLATDVCVGSVLATSELIYPQAVGGDIGCGMAALQLSDSTLNIDPEELLRALGRKVGMTTSGFCKSSPHLPFQPPSPSLLRVPHLRRTAERDGLAQLGSLGGGNHFLELQRSAGGELWLMVHSGSRAMGQAVAGHYIHQAKTSGFRGNTTALFKSSEVGSDYLHDQDWCVEYARANRTALLASAARALQLTIGAAADWSTLIDTPHNFVRSELHSGIQLLVHRKGAAPAASGQPGLIPGTAGTFSVHVEGRGEPRSLASSSHGAGRVMSRTEAKHAISVKDLRREMQGVTFDVARAGRLRDEAPSAYRDLRLVLEAEKELVKVVRTLRPIVSFKAGA